MDQDHKNVQQSIRDSNLLFLEVFVHLDIFLVPNLYIRSYRSYKSLRKFHQESILRHPHGKYMDPARPNMLYMLGSRFHLF